MGNFLSLFGSLFDPNNILESGGVGLLLLLVYLETAFFLGVLLPGGESLVFAAGLLAGTGYISLNVAWLIVFLIIASAAGDISGFFIGRKLGRKLFEKNRSGFLNKKHLEKAQRFYDKHGKKAILLGKFIPVIRPMVPAISGAVEMPAWQFILLSLLSSTIWINTFVLSAYFLGQKFPQLKNYIIYIIPITITIALIPVIINYFKNRNNKSSSKNS